MNSEKLYATVLLIIAITGFIVFYSAYNAFTEATQNYKELCGKQYMFPITLSNITYKGYVDVNLSGERTHYNVTLILKPSPVCTSPELTYGISILAESNGTRFYANPMGIWPANDLIKPIPADVLKERDAVSYTEFVNGMPMPYTLEYRGELPISTEEGAWSGLNFTVSNSTQGLLVAYTQGALMTHATVVYDSETGIPVIVHSVLNQSNGDSKIVHLELQKVDEPAQVRLNSLIFSSIASGLALAYAVKEFLA